MLIALKPTLEERAMNIDADDFRVKPDHTVDLKKWPTRIDPFYASKEDYQAQLARHISRLSEQQQKLYAQRPPLAAADFSGHGRSRQGRRDPPRHVRRQSAGLSRSPVSNIPAAPN